MKINNIMKTYKPELIASLGLSSLIGASLLSVLGTTKAVKKINDEKNKTGKVLLTKKEVLKLTWKYYIPSAVALGIGIPCILISNNLNVKESATYAVAYAATQSTLESFKQETAKVIGEEKTKAIESSVTQKQAESKAPENFSQFVISDDDKQVFYEPLSGRYIKTTWTDICAAKDRLNADAVTSVDDITLTDWFYELGLDCTDISDKIGWSVKNRGRNGLIDIRLDSMIVKNKSICAIQYIQSPTIL